MPVDAVVSCVLQEDGLVLGVWGCEVDRTAWVIQGGAADLQDEHEVTETSSYHHHNLMNKFFASFLHIFKACRKR